MKMRNTFSAAAIVAVMACSAAHAQVLGGNVGGAVNGALGGGLRDTSVIGNGNAAGSFGGELDTGSTLRKTRGAVGDTTGRARNVGANARNRSESTLAKSRDASANVATSTAAAAHAATDQQSQRLQSATAVAASKSTATAPHDAAPKLDSITHDVNGSASGNASASRKGVVAESAADGSAAASIETSKK